MSLFNRCFVLLVSAFAALALYLAAQPQPSTSTRNSPPSAAPHKAPTLPPPNLQDLAAGLGAASGSPNPEEEVHAGSIIAQQVRTAGEELKSLDLGTRIGALEQLAAYPTRESEELMLGALLGEPAESLRATAADALSEVRNPRRETISALAAAAVDPGEPMRSSALTTLDIYISREPYGSSRTRTILHDLRLQLKRRSLAAAARADIRDFLKDHAP